MEEKERFELFGKYCIKDNSPNARPQLFDDYVACVILNEQDKEIKQLKQSQKELTIENCELKKERLYFDLFFTRLQYIHKQADECCEEKERFGRIEDMGLDSVWRVFDLQKHECCEYEEMVELENGIESIAQDKLLRDIEHDLQFKPIRTVNEIFEEIQKIDNQIKKLRGGENE